jgi:hypothetical protein
MIWHLLANFRYMQAAMASHLAFKSQWKEHAAACQFGSASDIRTSQR